MLTAQWKEKHMGSNQDSGLVRDMSRSSERDKISGDREVRNSSGRDSRFNDKEKRPRSRERNRRSMSREKRKRSRSRDKNRRSMSRSREKRRRSRSRTSDKGETYNPFEPTFSPTKHEVQLPPAFNALVPAGNQFNYNQGNMYQQQNRESMYNQGRGEIISGMSDSTQRQGMNTSGIG